MNFKALAHSKLNNKSGFTLIEVLVAMAVFAIGILAITGMQVTSIQGNQSARLRTEAVSYASKHMDTLISNGYSAATDGSATEGSIILTWTVTGDSPVTGTKTIVLTATWDDKWGAKSVTLRYIMYNPD
ncbi:type IV pilus modification protein PilV [Desulfotignum phosphitoxidans]|jgi:type IV pilus modification protein PilV|uniref:Type IV pili assembly protein PilV n=1 Tax=Desulfotignum phosphitoxidans DSM 13687 TaxID=1286635 RepID=S0G6U3_9BACT|nr:type IV pilus modification protein PilV [Desulfotignum phosphitoxidans]EMS80592.1 type IV pili assembly protein PilV [Desulfotignum phosphitoxidans DSM 13687]